MKSLSVIIFCLFLFFSSLSFSESNIHIEDLWINEGPPNITVLAAYGLIANDGNASVILEKITSPQFEEIEIHQITTVNDISKMVKQPQLTIHANSTYQLTPGAMHMMLFNPKDRIKKGDTLPFTFYFSDGSKIETKANVKKLSDTANHHH